MLLTSSWSQARVSGVGVTGPDTDPLDPASLFRATFCVTLTQILLPEVCCCPFLFDPNADSRPRGRHARTVWSFWCNTSTFYICKLPIVRLSGSYWY